MSLYQIKAEIAAGTAEATDELFLEQEAAAWSVLQDVIAQRAWIVGIFPDELSARESWETIRGQLAATGVVPSEPAFAALEEKAWRDSYKAHFKPSRFGRLHWVPIWERESYPLPAGDQVVWLDPGLAFGTGNHETTRLCCRRLVEWAGTHGTGKRIIDAGCGSGILAISATRLGFKNVVGFDNDPEAVRVSGENAALNGLNGKIHFHEADLISGFQDRQGDLILANILGHILIQYRHSLLAAVAPGGTLVLSGILANERDAVRQAFAECAPDWKIDSRIDGEWADVALNRPSAG